MRALTFEEAVPAVPSAPNRTDVACFVGFVARRPVPVPADLVRWLDERGWIAPPYRRTTATDLLDVPVPIDNWETFDQLFDWDARPLPVAAARATTYLGAAVRSFFAEGGRRCYVVRVGDAWDPSTRAARRDELLQKLVPGYPSIVNATSMDQRTWRGVGHLFGLPDVSFLCLPDLPDLVAAEPPPVDPIAEVLGLEEHFTECSSTEMTVPRDDAAAARHLRAPRCDLTAYDRWAGVVEVVTSFLAARDTRKCCDVQLVASIPMPLEGSTEEGAFSATVITLIDRRLDPTRSPCVMTPDQVRGMASSFLQLAYPWARTAGSSALAEGLESPDAVLTGVLARNALTRGSFRSAGGSPLADVIDVFPLLRPEHLRGTALSSNGRLASAFEERVSLLGRAPSGMRLLSDVTATACESYRPASVHRLVSVIARAARRLGDEMTFDVSGESLWARVRDTLTDLLTVLYQAGALRGASPAEAFQVRCDRTTMTQSDIDAGRLIAEVRFEAAAPIEQIRVLLSLDDAGQLSLSMVGIQQEAA